jgi:hypothetical protein
MKRMPELDVARGDSLGTRVMKTLLPNRAQVRLQHLLRRAVSGLEKAIARISVRLWSRIFYEEYQ